MTTFEGFDPFEQRIAAAVDEIAAARRPAYLGDVLMVTAATAQLPRWRFLLSGAGRRRAGSPGGRVRFLVLLAVLLLGAIAAAVLVGSRLQAPHLVLGVFDPPIAAAPTDASPVVTLPDGRTLIFAVQDGQSNTRVDVFDPATGRIQLAGTTLGQAERVALMRDGRVLVMGGGAPGTKGGSVEIFDPATGRSTIVAKLSGSLVAPAALPDGRFVIFQDAVNEVWIFSPATGSATRMEPPPYDGYTATSVVLADGRVLLIEDFNSGLATPGLPVVQHAAIFDPATLRYTSLPPLPAARIGFTATPLRDGSVLIAGGAAARADATQSIPQPTAWRLDPATGTYASTGPLLHPRWWHGAALTADGRVLIAGGSLQPDLVGGTLTWDLVPERDTEIYDPATGRFVPGPGMTEARTTPIVTTLGDGSVLVLGGWSGPGSLGPLQDAERFR